VLVGYSEEEKPAPADKPIIDVSANRTNTKPLPQETEMPPIEATHNLFVKIMTQKADEAITEQNRTGGQSDLTRTANEAYEIITASSRTDDQVGKSYQTFIGNAARQLSDITRFLFVRRSGHSSS